MIKMTIMVAFIGYAFNIFSDPKSDMIFSWYGRILVRFKNSGRFGKYVSMPLGLCIMCNTFWIGFILSFYLEAYIITALAISISASGMSLLILKIDQGLTRYITRQ
jgi:hypothetical protein